MKNIDNIISSDSANDSAKKRRRDRFEQYIERINQETRIIQVAILLGYRKLKPKKSLDKYSRSIKILCPSHKEDTPSCSLDPFRNIFNCMGCGTGGNVYDFVFQHFKRMNYSDKLARQKTAKFFKKNFNISLSNEK